MCKCIVWVIFVSLVLCLAPLGAQTTTGEMVGTIAGATITMTITMTNSMTKMDTNIAVKTTTSASGSFVVTAQLEDRHV